MTRGLTTREAGALAGVSHETIRRWCDAGIIACSRLPMSGQRRIDPRAIDQLVRSMRSNENAATGSTPVTASEEADGAVVDNLAG